MRAHLMRHGETDVNAAGRLQGRLDSQLTERGQRQARDMAVASLAWRPMAIYTSPLQRARAVAIAISTLTGCPVVEDNRLAEMDMGDLEGVTVPQMRAGWPDLYAGWRRDVSSVTMPGGESLGDVQQRALAALADIDRQHDADDAVIMVTHNFTIRCIVAGVIELPLSQINRFDLALASRTTIQTGARGPRLRRFNSIEHLSPDNRIDDDW